MTAAVTAIAHGWTVRRVGALREAHIDGLARVLIDCVEGGAAVHFLAPLGYEKAVAFWSKVAHAVAAGDRVLLLAQDALGVCGTVHLVLDLPENQPHRAGVSKLLVHRRARGLGIGAALMRASEELAAGLGKTLLTLDTSSGVAARLYEKLGWVRAGAIPGYALLPNGQPCETAMYYRTLPR